MRSDVDRITDAGRTPHGYTLAIWAAGMFCISRDGLPTVLDILLFTLGATGAFGAVRLIVLGCWSGQESPTRTATRSPLPSVHVLALPGAVLVSWLLASTPAPWSWLVTASGATAAFVILHSGQDALWRHWRSRPN